VEGAVELGSEKRSYRYLTVSDRPLPAPRPAPSPAPIERELGRAAAYAQSALAPATRRAYESDWRAFADWCAPRGLTPIPATPAAVTAFLASEADREFRPAAATQSTAHQPEPSPYEPRTSSI